MLKRSDKHPWCFEFFVFYSIAEKIYFVPARHKSSKMRIGRIGNC